jgi:co-chaperonin GroES (HSP10)
MIQPTGLNILVKRIYTDKDSQNHLSGLIRPIPTEARREDLHCGEIITLGFSYLPDCSARILPFKKGYLVLFGESAGKTIVENDQEYILLRYEEIQGLIIQE